MGCSARAGVTSRSPAPGEVVEIEACRTYLASLFEAGERGGGPGSRVMVTNDGDGADDPGGVPPALTDARGHYQIGGLPRAAYNVVAEAQRGELRARATHLKPDATVHLQLRRVTKLEGTVTGPSGPTALFSVEIDGPTRAQRSFTDGGFSFGRVDPGTYSVLVQSDDGHGQVKVEVKPGTPATVAITLVANAQERARCPRLAKRRQILFRSPRY